MLMLQIYMCDETVVWSMWAPRPCKDWASLGTRYWERRGEVQLGMAERNHRQLLTASLTAILDRLGESEHLGGSGM